MRQDRHDTTATATERNGGAPPGASTAQPLFIFSLTRSGSTLLQRILSTYGGDCARLTRSLVKEPIRARAWRSLGLGGSSALRYVVDGDR